MPRLPSRTHDLILEAMRGRKQVICTYKGLRREICPIVLGLTNGEEQMLAYQFGGRSSRPMRGPKTRWRCMKLSDVRDAELREGEWHSGGTHSQAQSCVQVVDYDVNPDSPFNPRFKL